MKLLLLATLVNSSVFIEGYIRERERFIRRGENKHGERRMKNQQS